ncbi:2-phosphosulfolactate phosphatase [Peribacillus frigoritolerans]|nr:2-phosphosulfolactate phosphatase [Peribacillus frigoritolerans]
MAGELKAKPVDDLMYPSPTLLSKLVRGKTLILSTTNGTVALRNSAAAKRVYIASLLNNPSVAEKNKKNIIKQKRSSSFVRENSGEFSLEDFYGAGHLIDCLIAGSQGTFILNDAAKAANALYRTNSENAFDILKSSYVGQLFDKHSLIADLELAARKRFVGSCPRVGGWKDRSGIEKAGNVVQKIQIRSEGDEVFAVNSGGDRCRLWYWESYGDALVGRRGKSVVGRADERKAGGSSCRNQCQAPDSRC